MPPVSFQAKYLPSCVRNTREAFHFELCRYVVQRFPFLIFYAEFGEFIWIVAIAHAKRKPNYWSMRQLD
jgi:hypothetical protein